jgi:hypothetical protein
MSLVEYWYRGCDIDHRSQIQTIFVSDHLNTSPRVFISFWYPVRLDIENSDKKNVHKEPA